MGIGDNVFVPSDPGGGGNAQQSDIRTGITRYRVSVDDQYVELKDYCPLFKDCTVHSVTAFKDNSYPSKSIQGVIKYPSDNWVKGYTIPYRSSTTSTDVFCVAGYKPQFQELYALHNNGNAYVIIEKTSTKLILRRPNGSSYFEATASYFKDRVLPKRLLVVMQGGGGAGCSSHKTNTGNGGGAGGHVAVIINLEKTGGYFQVYVGYGGVGGEDKSGENGLDTQLMFIRDNGTSLLLAAARGGIGGKKESKGFGGDYYINYGSAVINDYFYIVNTTFGSGGNGGTGGNVGQSMSLRTIHSTNHPTDKNIGINKTIIGGFDGGDEYGDVTTGGSGGASAFAKGGYVNWGGAEGGEGSRGSGGGGGSFFFGTFFRGGNGGHGSVIFYY